LAAELSLAANPTGFVLVGCAAFVAGAMNAMAGGGSFLTFPALLGVHIPPVNANATSTVALWPGQIASLFAFRSELRAGRSLLMPVMIAGAIGGSLGAWVLLHTAQATFQSLVPWLLLFATVLFAASGSVTKRLKQISPAHHPDSPFPIGLFLSLLPVTFYIGYFGAGAGFLVISILSVFGIRSMNEMNALKVACTSLANGIAVLTFLVAGAVYWRECLLMIGLATAGGYIGAAYSRKMNPKILRGFIIVTGAALSAYYFYR
jgi:uncharacterized protein